MELFVRVGSFRVERSGCFHILTVEVLRCPVIACRSRLGIPRFSLSVEAGRSIQETSTRSIIPGSAVVGSLAGVPDNALIAALEDTGDRDSEGRVTGW